MKTIKNCECCKEGHMISELPQGYPWVICTTCYTVEQVDPFDQTCSHCHQRTIHGLPDNWHKKMTDLKKQTIKKWGDST